MEDTETRPLAVVTGASSGIGHELAKQFAEAGFELVVAAEDDELHAAARELESLGATVAAVQVDLASEEGVDELWRQIGEVGRPVDAIALNAGIGAGGAFATGTDLRDELKLIDLNVRSTVRLAKYAVRDMAERGWGRVLFTSSIASTMPGSFQAVYNASKSFVQSFALALRDELKDTGVTVTSLMPGPTETEFFERADMLDTKVGTSDKDDPAAVARAGFEALMADKERAVAASLSTKAQGRASRLLPDSIKARMHRRMAEPGSAKKQGASVALVGKNRVMEVLARALAAGLSLNRVGFGLAYLVAPARAGKGWVGRAARDPATQVFARGHGARDIALGAGALGTLVRGQPRQARDWMCAQALTDGTDLVATLASRRCLPSSGSRFAMLMAGGSIAVAVASATLLHAANNAGRAIDSTRR